MSKERIAEIEAEQIAICNRQKVLRAEWQKLRGADLDTRLNTLFDGGITLEKVMSLDWNELGNHGSDSDWYDLTTAFLNGQIRGVYNKETGENEGPMPLRGLHRNGCQKRPDGKTLQTAFQVMMRQCQPVEEQLGLLVILPFVCSKDGWKVFDIFEASLSISSSYYLRVSLCGKQAEVWEGHGFQRGGNPMHKATGENAIVEALTYIHAHLPYERRDPDSNELSDDDSDFG